MASGVYSGIFTESFASDGQSRGGKKGYRINTTLVNKRNPSKRLCIVGACCKVQRFNYKCTKHFEEEVYETGDYGKYKQCNEDGCIRVAVSRGRCCMHDSRWRHSRPDFSKVCSDKDCERHVYARGLCDYHWYPLKTKKTCEVKGCQRHASAKKLCPAHYGRMRRHGDPEVGPPLRDPYSPPRVCSIDGCERSSEWYDNGAKGMCQRHYKRKHEGRNMDGRIKSEGPCKTPGCKLLADRKYHGRDGYCGPCYSGIVWKRRNLILDIMEDLYDEHQGTRGTINFF